ncbi:hypothetical protein K438DRAFT_1774268 [Mycena galopus ATCC 62051]|nr:hypothetical protein K438DRAFT_1774268 [Mycena galopus ATCC 62051]
MFAGKAGRSTRTAQLPFAEEALRHFRLFNLCPGQRPAKIPQDWGVGEPVDLLNGAIDYQNVEIERGNVHRKYIKGRRKEGAEEREGRRMARRSIGAKSCGTKPIEDGSYHSRSKQASGNPNEPRQFEAGALDVRVEGDVGARRSRVAAGPGWRGRGSVTGGGEVGATAAHAHWAHVGMGDGRACAGRRAREAWVKDARGYAFEMGSAGVGVLEVGRNVYFIVQRAGIRSRHARCKWATLARVFKVGGGMRACEVGARSKGGRAFAGGWEVDAHPK